MSWLIVQLLNTECFFDNFLKLINQFIIYNSIKWIYARETPSASCLSVFCVVNVKWATYYVRALWARQQFVFVQGFYKQAVVSAFRKIIPTVQIIFCNPSYIQRIRKSWQIYNPWLRTRHSFDEAVTSFVTYNVFILFVRFYLWHRCYLNRR